MFRIAIIRCSSTVALCYSARLPPRRPGSIQGRDMSVLGPLVLDGDNLGQVSPVLICNKRHTIVREVRSCSMLEHRLDEYDEAEGNIPK
jgi:hypothetical protein